MYEIFERLIKEKGISMYRVSKDTGIATATLSDWKHGRSKPKLDKLLKICTYLNIKLDDLIKEE